MTTWALALSLLSGLAWAGLDISRKQLARSLTAPVVAAGLAAGAALLFGGWTALSLSPVAWRAYLPPASAALVLSVAIQVLIIESVRRADLSRMIPLLSFTPVATTLFGAAVLGEHPSVRQWLGVILVVTGGSGLSLSRERRLRMEAGSLLMLAAALCISAAAPFDKLAVAASSVAFHGFLQSLGSVAILALLLGLRGELGALASAARRRPLLLLAALLAFGALGLQFAAYGGAMVGLVESIKRVVGMTSSLVAGAAVFGEAVTAAKVAWIALMAAGVVLMLA